MRDMEWPLREITRLHAMRHVGALLRQLENYEMAATTPKAATSLSLERIKADAKTWAEAEAVFGRGATLNLDHPRVQKLRRMAPFIKIIPVEYFERAQKFIGTEDYHSLFAGDRCL